MLVRIGLQLIECVVVDISILMKPEIALIIGLNTNNSATENDPPANFFINLNPMLPMGMHASEEFL